MLNLFLTVFLMLALSIVSPTHAYEKTCSKTSCSILGYSTCSVTCSCNDANICINYIGLRTDIKGLLLPAINNTVYASSLNVALNNMDYICSNPISNYDTSCQIYCPKIDYTPYPAPKCQATCQDCKATTICNNYAAIKVNLKTINQTYTGSAYTSMWTKIDVDSAPLNTLCSNSAFDTTPSIFVIFVLLIFASYMLL